MPLDAVIEVVPAGSRVLDTGCGDGLFLGLLSSLGTITSGHGFDTSSPAISAAKEMAERTGTPLTFERLDAKARWPDGEFDAVSMIDVLHHVSPAAQQSVVGEALSRVRPKDLFNLQGHVRHPLLESGDKPAP